MREELKSSKRERVEESRSGADGEEVAPLEGDFLAEDRVGVGAVAVLSSL